MGSGAPQTAVPRQTPGPRAHLSVQFAKAAMRPFTPTEVAKYLIWVVLAVAVTVLLIWRLFLAHGHEGIHSQRYGSAVELHLPDCPVRLPPSAVARRKS